MITSTFAKQNESPLSYLNAMTQAHRSQNYELLYILQENDNILSLRFRHANYKGKEYAQLLRLDNQREEMILRDGIVSYFGDFQPFSLSSHQIIDDLPSPIYADFNRLEGYHFIDAGRERVADRLARVIRIVPEDPVRYQYVLWIDEESYLLLRSDLRDRDHTLLEQFKVIQLNVDDELLYIAQPIQSLALPPLIQPYEKSPKPLNWQPNWLPNGFKLVNLGQQRLSDMLIEQDEVVESQMYTDGLFSFTIYLVENKGLIFNEQFWRQGKMSVYSQTFGHKDIIVIGELPPVSARHLVQEISHLQYRLPNSPLVEGKSQ